MRHRPTVWRQILAPALALSLGTAALSQQETRSTQPTKPQQPEVIDLTRQTEVIELTGRQVPYATRAAAFLWALAYSQQLDHEDGKSRTSAFLSTFGLKPDSLSATELCEVALAMEASMAPYHPDTYKSLDGQALITAQKERQLARHSLAGHSLGIWLRNRDNKEEAIDLLLDQILDNPYMSISIGTTDSQIDVAALAAKAEAFERGMESALGFVPRKMRHADAEDQEAN